VREEEKLNTEQQRDRATEKSREVLAQRRRDAEERRRELLCNLMVILKLSTAHILIAMLMFSVAACLPSQEELALDGTETALTASYAEEVRSIIEANRLRTSSLEVQLDPNLYEEVATGPWFELLQSTHEHAEDQSSFMVIQSISFREVRVLKYAASEFRAVACGTWEWEEVSASGETIRSYPIGYFKAVYVFIRDGNEWKLAAWVDFGDADGTLRDWDYVDDDTKAQIGDIEQIIDRHFGCGLNVTQTPS
jgi:hypothetical protein